jgi:VWFA-related protein
VSEESGSAQEFAAEGIASEVAGTVRIRAPRRDVAPNLFVVDVDVKPPVSRVEFYVEGKKIFTKNAPPYRAELDLGELPNRVELRVIGYDRSGRYIDADAWIVNERENVVEVKLTKTDTKDGLSHLKVSLQNPQKISIVSMELFADERLVKSWEAPPYAIALKTAALQGVKMLRATAKAGENVEYSDVMMLDGASFGEALEVNLVELPVSVTNSKGAPVTDLKSSDFELLEDGKAQEIDNVAFATDLPLSLGIMVDHSGSMQPRIEAAREAALVFAREVLDERDRAFFGGFSWEAAHVSPFVSNADALRGQIATLPEAEGGTALYDAIITGLYKFRGVEGRKALVIVTDGEDTASRVDYDQMLSYARASRTPLYFIGIGMSFLGGTSRLKALASETGGVAYLIRNTNELADIYEQIEQELRTQYLVRYYTKSSGKNDHRYRKTEIKVKREGAKVRTVRGFIP